MKSINRKWKESGSSLSFKDWIERENKKNQQSRQSEIMLNRIENNFKAYAGSYLAIDNIKYDKGSLIISRAYDKGEFSDVEKCIIERFLSLYEKYISSFEVKGNKIEIFI